jgi:hypothetical protein
MNPGLTCVALDFDGTCASGAGAAPPGSRVLDMTDLGPSLRLRTSRREAAAATERFVAAHKMIPGPWLTFIGTGDYHHVSLMLLEAMTLISPVTVIVIDNHPDWAVLPPRYHCGNWVSGALGLPSVEGVELIGQDSSDLDWKAMYVAPMREISRGKLRISPLSRTGANMPLMWREGGPLRREIWGTRASWLSMNAAGIQATFERVATSLKGKDVYLSIDKDCLVAEDAATDWEPGGMGLSDVLAGVSVIADRCRIVGADVCGDKSAAELSGFIKRLDAGRSGAWTPPTHAEIELNRAANAAIAGVLRASTPPATGAGR